MILFAAAWMAQMGCKALECGPGTKQVQQKDGALRCVPVDAPPSSIPCNVDGGAAIVGGECVSTITCGANTTFDPVTKQCVASGGPMRGTPPACPAPAAGNICINGILRHLIDNSLLSAGETMQVALFEPLTFLTSPTPTPMTDVDGNPAVATTDDGFVFQNIKAPAAGLVAIAVADVSGNTTHAFTGTGGRVLAGQTYQIDGFVTDKTTVAAWSASSGGIDYNTQGAYFVRFYSDPVPSPNKLVWTDTMPVSGVQLFKGGAAPAEARYFSSNLTTIDTGLTSTSSLGAAIVPALGLVANYTGSGGMFNSMPITWNTQPGGTKANVVFVAKFNRCTTDPCE